MAYLTRTCKVGAYIRLSKEDEGKNKESESITNQREYIKEYAEKNEMDIYDYYVDDGYSGINYNRPAFEEMLEDISNNKIDTIITKDLSRLGREYKDKPIFFVISGGINHNKMQELNINYYLSKPYTNEQLFNKLNEIYNAKYQK